MESTLRSRRGPALALLGTLLCALPARPQGLTSIDMPQGARLTFGQVPGETTEAGAMGAILRNIHQHVGDRPQVSRLFQVKGTQSVAAFFTVTNRSANSVTLKGMLIALKVDSESVQAALITGPAEKFNADLNPALKRLMEVWRPFEAAHPAPPGSARGAQGDVAPLHQVELPDHSAAAMIPADWRIMGGGGGTMVVTGPNHESIYLGSAYNVKDLNHPTVRQQYMMAQRGGPQAAMARSQIFYPSGGDLGRAFVEISNQFYRTRQIPPGRITLTSVTPLQVRAPGRICARLSGSIQLEEENGARELNATFCEGPTSPAAGIYMAYSNQTQIPAAVADKERATAAAVLASFAVNQGIVDAQANAFAKPIIDNIKATTKAAMDRNRASQEAFEIHNSSVYQSWDDRDKRNQEFHNYILDQSVVLDNRNNAHGTLWNADADALVKYFPQRFEYVSAPDFWKGIDY